LFIRKSCRIRNVITIIEWYILALILIFAGCILFGLTRSKASREVGFAEGIDDAGVADAFGSLQELPQFKMMRRKIVEHVAAPSIGKPVSDGMSLLDLGCGTGHLLKAFHDESARERLPRLKLYGIDLGVESIRFCQEKLAAAHITDVDLREGDGANMPYSDESIDIVVSSLSLHHWTEPLRVLDEIYRVLTPEGLFVLFDMRRDCRRVWHWFLRFATRFVVPKPLRRVREPRGSLLAAYTSEELKELMARTKWAHAEQNVEGFLFAQFLEARK
jgi:ubiquinone/menaquinone biosynthesis C-methylase UbiE